MFNLSYKPSRLVKVNLEMSPYKSIKEVIIARFGILIALLVNSQAFCNIRLWLWVKISRNFKNLSYPHFHGQAGY
jgi:hypothetical protein